MISIGREGKEENKDVGEKELESSTEYVA